MLLTLGWNESIWRREMLGGGGQYIPSAAAMLLAE